MREDVLFGGYKPPGHAYDSNESSDADCIVHVCRRNGPYGWEKQYNTDKENPDHSNRIHRSTPSTHGVWTFDEWYAVLVYAVGNDDSNVTEVECWSCNVEDCHNCLARANADEIESAAKGDHEPYRIDRCSSKFVDLAPDPENC